MYKPSTYLPVYLNRRPISYKIGYQGETEY